MSSIKLAPNASGTGALTIAAPNTNTDLTFNLGTALGNNGASALVSTDANGNLGLGVTPSAWSAQAKALEIGIYAGFYRNASGLTEVAFNSYQNTSNNDTYRVSANPAAKYQIGGGHQWYTAPSGTAGNAISFTQAMTLDASGNLLVGTTSQVSSAARASFVTTSSGAWAVAVRGQDRGYLFQNVTSSGIAAYFTTNNDSQVAGQITVNNTSTTYATSSDYRLKENIQPMTGALAKVAALKPCTYSWKFDGAAGQGFIAHELADVVPDAVIGEKDAVDAEGNPQYQGIDTSFLVATLTAAIQEQQSIITAQAAALESLTARITALEAA